MEELREALKIASIGADELSGLLESTFASDEEGLKEVTEQIVGKNEIQMILPLITFMKGTISNTPSRIRSYILPNN